MGATVGPVICSAFLVPLTGETDNISNTTAIAQFTDNVTSLVGTKTIGSENDSMAIRAPTTANLTLGTALHAETNDDGPDVSFVRFAYVTIAGIILLTTTGFVVLFVKNGVSCKDVDRHVNRAVPRTPGECSKDGRQELKRQKCYTITVSFLVLFLAFMDITIELTTIQLLASYVIKGLGWSNSNGALVTSVYWGAHTTGRVIGIGLSIVLPARHLVVADTALNILGFTLMAFSHLGDVITWIASAIVGLGLATVFPGLILVAAEEVKVGSRLAAMFVVVTGLGSMAGPSLVSFLMELIYPRCFVYTLLASELLFAAVLLFAKLYIWRASKKAQLPQDTNEDVKNSQDTIPL